MYWKLLQERAKMAKGKHYVPGHKWKRGRDGTHPGYFRKTRPKGKKRIIGKSYTMQEIRDEQGYLRGWKRKKK